MFACYCSYEILTDPWSVSCTHTLCWLLSVRVTHRPLGQCLMHYIAERWTCPLWSSPLIACFVWRFLSWSWCKVSTVSCCCACCCGCCFCQLTYARTAQWDRGIQHHVQISVVRSRWVSLGIPQVCTYQQTLDVSFKYHWAAKKESGEQKNWGKSPQAVWAINIWLSFLWFAN